MEKPSRWRNCGACRERRSSISWAFSDAVQGLRECPNNHDPLGLATRVTRLLSLKPAPTSMGRLPHRLSRFRGDEFKEADCERKDDPVESASTVNDGSLFSPLWRDGE